MRVVVIGQTGQVAQSLSERASSHGAIVTLVGRPQIDLADPSGIGDVLAEIGGDIIVNAAAYTAVDQAESEGDLAEAINGIGAGAVAGAAASLRIPMVQISTDYVFDGQSPQPYQETDRPHPLGAYGRSKLLGEVAVASATDDYAILRTAWIYSPFGKNFVKTMLRLAGDRDEIPVVADQVGAPTSALDIADGILAVCRNLIDSPGRADLRGIFHMTAAGSGSWADLAAETFVLSQKWGGPHARVRPITTADYPTPARRPANARLDCTKIAAAHGVRLPPWKASLEPVIRRLVGRAEG
ncbi:dTDP-4-dehydrorhamnose reductase [Microvirga antarctica]|uniref:dTDP-4-dehydrorhamnose reductase n=1 Tax=Microvirga antarctica TaxID=2819233 RepID=UPI001B3176EB